MNKDTQFKLTLAKTILIVDGVQNAYLQGEAALIKQISMTAFFDIEKMSLKKRLEELYMISTEHLFEYLDYVLKEEVEKQNKKVQLRNKKNIDVTLIKDLFYLETEVIPSIFRHRKDFWLFLKKILSPKTAISFVNECDDIWSTTFEDSYPIPDFAFENWENSHENGNIAMEVIYDVSCLMEPFILFALDENSFRDSITSKSFIQEMNDLNNIVIQKQKQQLSNGIDSLKFEAVKTLLKTRVEASKVLFETGTELSNSDIAGTRPYYQAEHVYQQIDLQKEFLEKIEVKTSSTQDLIEAFKDLYLQTAEIINNLEELTRKIPQKDITWKNIASLIDNQSNANMMLNSAAQMEHM